MIEVFTFDLGNVIIPFDHSSIARRLIQYSKNQWKYSYEDIHKYLYRVAEVEHQYEEGKISTDEFINSVVKRFELNISADEFTSIFNDIFFEIDDKMERLIKRIKDSGYPLILLSNTNEMHFNYILNRYPLISIFDEFILSYRVGFRKPDERIYRVLLKMAKCNPDEIFYVDDISEYVGAAKNLGIDAHQFTSIDELSNLISRLIYQS
ncbi:MAG: HAD family hydrolase [Myxococcota bacterium]